MTEKKLIDKNKVTVQVQGTEAEHTVKKKLK